MVGRDQENAGVLGTIKVLSAGFSIYDVPIFSLFSPAEPEYEYFSEEQLQEIGKNLNRTYITLDEVLSSANIVKDVYLQDYPTLSLGETLSSSLHEYLWEVNRYLGRPVFGNDSELSVNTEQHLTRISEAFTVRIGEILKHGVPSGFRTAEEHYKDHAGLFGELMNLGPRENLDYDSGAKELTMRVRKASFTGKPVYHKIY